MSSLVEHARRELELCGQYKESPEYAESIIKAIEGFVSFGHSGGSAMVAIGQLYALLQRENLAPLTSDPGEWEDRSEISGYPVWQNNRNSSAFSEDAGKTWWLLSDREPKFAKAFKAVEQETEKEFDGVQFPSGRCVLDHPETGLAWVATSIEELPGIDHVTITWAK